MRDYLLGNSPPFISLGGCGCLITHRRSLSLHVSIRFATYCGMALLVHYATFFCLAVVTLLFVGYHGIVAGNVVALQESCAVVVVGTMYL